MEPFTHEADSPHWARAALANLTALAAVAMLCAGATPGSASECQSCLGPPTFGEPCTLSFGAYGTVTDQVTAQPIAGASVALGEGPTVSSDLDGSFAVSAVREETCNIDYSVSVHVTAVGYQPFDWMILSWPATVFVDAELVPLIAPVPTQTPTPTSTLSPAPPSTSSPAPTPSSTATPPSTPSRTTTQVAASPTLPPSATATVAVVPSPTPAARSSGTGCEVDTMTKRRWGVPSTLVFALYLLRRRRSAPG